MTFRVVERLVVVGCLLAFGFLAIHSMRQKNPTFDETTHLPAGISYVQTGDFRMNPEHPALPKLLAGWFASRTGVKVDDTSAAWKLREQWDFGKEVLYEGGAPWRDVLFWGRVPMVAIGVLLGGVLWGFARALAGPVSALVVLVLYSFSPNFLAHTRLVTTDVPLTLSVVGTVACLWASWKTGRLRWMLGAGAFVGLSMVTKFSAFSYAPVYLLLALLPSEERPFRKSAWHLLVFVLASVVATELLIWASYRGATDFVSIRELGLRGRGVSVEAMGFVRRIPYEVMSWVPWPSREFATGLKDVMLHTESGHPVYLLGKRAEAGWWWMSFATLLVKTPLVTLGLLLLSLGALVVRPATRRMDLWFLVLPIALVLGTNIAAKLGLGVRHLLPAFPFFMILASLPFRGSGVSTGVRPAVVVGLLLVVHVIGTVGAHPHYLPFFNRVAGGSSGGHRWLADSNLDWGQDLSAATTALKERGVQGAVLCYFGTADPFVEDMNWQVLPPTQRAKSRDPWKVLSHEGPQWLVMSATNRQGVYYRLPDGSRPYAWLDTTEPEATIGHSIYLYNVGRDAEVQWGFYEMYRRHGMTEEAFVSLRRVLNARRFDANARQLLVPELMARGDSVEVERILADAPNPDPSEVLLLIDLLKTRGETVRVNSLFERGLTVFRSDMDWRNSYAWHLVESGGSLELAQELIDEAVREEPDDPYFLDTRAMVLLARGRAAEAATDLERALTLPNGDLPELRWHLVQALNDAGRVAEARRVHQGLVESPRLQEPLRTEVEAWTPGR